ncbi:fatty acyl-CoA hydrolase precursor, medium chain-like [Mytilus edulis]|uniref:fatty acyl-CoA hydrolase precursor, medium chain-like n=1 Tax=Mytilus edulis TaxID=6550 RepID=UPI0039F12428
MMHVLLVLSLAVVTVLGQSTITVNTRLGKLKGVSSSVNDGNSSYQLRIYKNIPYAKPPVGQLRFMEPVAHGKWTGTLDATRFGPSCIQLSSPSDAKFLPNLNQSEDCLQLNIYAPVNASSSNKKSVMVWIHGGGYSNGQAMLFDASYLSALGDVVVVTVNYRLHILGFFSTSDSVAPGNYGLWDQKLAIKWVHDNIDQYGGDPMSVTIFGESAGGFSVALQAISPNNRGLFQRVIAQSGVSNTLLATSPIPRQSAKALANDLDCSDELTDDTMSCLRNKSADEIRNSLLTLTKQFYLTPDIHIYIAFAPVVDNNFLIDTPQNIMSGKGPAFEFYKSLDVIIGNCESEGSLLVSTMHTRNYTNLKRGIPSELLCTNIIPTMVADYFQNNTDIIKPICDQYKVNGLPQQSMNAVNYYGDIFMYSPAVQSLQIHAAQSTHKHFQYISRRSSIWSLSTKQYAPWFKGPGHASEIPFLFPFKSLSNATEDDKNYSVTMIKYWSNFAKTGDTNGDGLPVWKQYDLVTRSYIVLDVNVTTQQNLYKDRIDFWLQTIPNILNATKTTTSAGTISTATSSEEVSTQQSTPSMKTTPTNPGNGCQSCIPQMFYLVIVLLFACLAL